MRYLLVLSVVISVLSTVVGLCADIWEFASESTALNFTLVFMGLIGILASATALSNSRLRQVSCILTIVFLSAFFGFSWTRAGPHAVWEEVSCALNHPHCSVAKIMRMSLLFGDIQVKGFNKEFTENEQEKHREFCARQTNKPRLTEVALFELRTYRDEKDKIEFNYALSAGSDWWIAAHIPSNASEEKDTNVSTGRMLADRVTRSGMYMGPGPATVLVRVCGVPIDRKGEGDVMETDFWRSLDVRHIDVE